MSKDWGVIGHAKQVELLKTCVVEDRLFQTYLFVGPESIGKRLVATKFVQCSLTGKNPEIDADHPSVKKIEHGNSDELIVFDAEKITIKDVRGMKERFQNKVFTRTFCIIDSYENILPEAQQTLLKMLEEPIQDLHFIILARSLKNVLETIQSRSQIVRFSPVSKTLLSEFSKNQSELGRPGLLIDEEKGRQFSTHADFLRGIISRGLIDRFSNAEKLAKDEDIDILLKNWIAVLHLTLHAKIENREVEEYLQKYSVVHLSKLIVNLSAARSLVKKNVNKRLILENVCMSF